jgi:hypothetical protein
MCDCLVALAPATGGDRTLLAKNSDRSPGERQVVEWWVPRLDRGTVRVTHIEIDAHHADTYGCLLSRPAWCWGAEHGVNTAGVAIGNEAIYTRLDPRSAPDALIGMDLVRLGLERAASAGEAINVMTGLLERYGQGGSGHDADRFPHPRPYWSSFLVADPHRAFVLETSGSTWAVEEVEEVRAISNRTTIPTFDAEHRHPRQPVERLVDPRWQASQRVLRERPVTVELLAAHLRSHDTCVDEGWSVCMHVDDVEETTASMIAELDPQGGPHRVLMLLGHPCESEYVEHRIGG